MNQFCPGCSNDQGRDFGVKDGHHLYVCPACGTIYADCLPETDDVRELYDHYYDVARFELEPVVAETLERLVSLCEPYRHLGRWLDVGYGEGGLLQIAQRRGWACFGIEVSASARAFGERQGWAVTPDATEDKRFEAEGFDIVTMIEFVEHSLAPRKALESAARLLRPGGLLFLTTPNAASINRWMLGVRWSVFSPPEHVTIWTGAGLSGALTEAGLEVIRVRTEGLNPGEVMHKLRRSIDTAPSRNEVAFALNRAMSKSPARRALKRVINQMLSLFGIGDSLKIWAVKNPH